MKPKPIKKLYYSISDDDKVRIQKKGEIEEIPIDFVNISQS
jgi:hypothetical protein